MEGGERSGEIGLRYDKEVQTCEGSEGRLSTHRNVPMRNMPKWISCYCEAKTGVVSVCDLVAPIGKRETQRRDSRKRRQICRERACKREASTHAHTGCIGVKWRRVVE